MSNQITITFHADGFVTPAAEVKNHLTPCICTIDSRTGEIVDYDCGR